MKINNEELRALLRLVDLTNADEIDCDEFLSRASRYIEDLLSGDGAKQQYDALVHHLKVCPECLEEFEAHFSALRDGL